MPLDLPQNKLQFIQKTRPKLKQGDVFYYLINHKIYFGLVFLTKLHSEKDNVSITIILPNYSLEKIDEFSEKMLIEKIENGDLIAPPINTNKKIWLLGFFQVFKHIDISLIKRLDNFRAINFGRVYDKHYHLLSDVFEDKKIPDILFLEDIGTYSYEGVEYLIQVGLGLGYDCNENPYGFYESDLVLQCIDEKNLPYWYFNSIGKTLIKP